MFKKVSVNPNVQFSDEGNYSIDISPSTSEIALSTNNTCSIYSKDIFIENQDKLPNVPQIQLGNTITNSKYTKNGNTLIISDFEYKISLYSPSENSIELKHQFDPGNCK